MKTSTIFNQILHPRSRDEVEFIVKGSSEDYDITIKEPSGNLIQKPLVRKGFKQSFTAIKGDYVYLSAQSNHTSSEVHIEILYQGKTFKEATLKGDYPIAQVGGCLC
jgi:hypothetical protein